VVGQTVARVPVEEHMAKREKQRQKDRLSKQVTLVSACQH
jgi:hypothetical protein